MLSLTGCGENKVIDVKPEEEHALICNNGYIAKGKSVDFTKLVRDTLKKDEKNYEYDKTLFSLYYENKMFFSYEYNLNDQMIGYIDIGDFSVTYTYVSYEKNFEQAVFYPIIANEDCCIFIEYKNISSQNHSVVYDYNTNEIVSEKDSEDDSEFKELFDEYYDSYRKSRYECEVDGKTYYLRSVIDNVRILDENENIILTMDYDYILSRSEKLQKIDSLVGALKGKLKLSIYVMDNEIYVVIQSIVTLEGGEGLIPVAFKYNMNEDIFTYVGASPYGDIQYIC